MEIAPSDGTNEESYQFWSSKLKETCDDLDFLDKKIKEFMLIEKDNPLYEYAMKIIELKGQTRFKYEDEKEFRDENIRRLYNLLAKKIESSNYESKNFDMDIGPYLVKPIAGIKLEVASNIIQRIHQKYLEMDTAEKKKFQEFCVEYLKASLCRDPISANFRFRWIMKRVSSGNPFPQIDGELKEWNKTTPYNYMPLFGILGNFCVFGMNYLYPLICLKTNFEEQLEMKKIYEEQTQNSHRRIKIFARIQELLLVEKMNEEQLIDVIESDIDAMGFAAFIPTKSRFECMDRMKYVIDQIDDVKEYLITMDPDGYILNPITKKIFYPPLLETYQGWDATQCLRDFIVICRDGLRKWIQKKYLLVSNL